MKTAHGAILVSAGYLMLVVVCELRSSPPSVEEVEQKSIKYRLENIKRGYVRYHVIDEEPRSRQSEYLYEITFDENKRARQIRRGRLRGKTEWGKPEKIIVTPETVITDDEYIPTPTAVNVTPAKVYKSPREHLRVGNVQALGMDLGGASSLHIVHVESLLNRTDRSEPVIHADHRGDIETWRIDFKIKPPQLKTETNVSLWIAPSQGFNIVCIESHSDRAGKHSTRTINTEMKQYPEGGIWYPSKLVMIGKSDDRVIRRQVVLVEEARFGGPINDADFTLAGLDLKPGRHIGDSTSGQPRGKVWNGKESVDPSRVKSAPPIPPRPRRPRWLQLALGVGLGLIAAIYFWRAFRRRRSTSNPGA